jgi:plastocyanin
MPTQAYPQNPAAAEVRGHLEFSAGKKTQVIPAVLWLKPIDRTPAAPFAPHAPYTLLQKHKMFSPHLLVVPVGSKVLFPNADPFFHNVFSLFEGKRFDLGLYEAGSTKEVTFSREGISYIFCNIHPEMSAVVLALSTSLYAIADSGGEFRLHAVPAGDYELHVWVEGVQQSALEQLTRHVQIVSPSADLGEFHLPAIAGRPQDHLNKFGQKYDKDAKPPY